MSSIEAMADESAVGECMRTKLGVSKAAVSPTPCTLNAAAYPLSGVRVQGVQGYLAYIRNNAQPGPYSRAMPRALCWSQGGELFLMSEVPL